LVNNDGFAYALYYFSSENYLMMRRYFILLIGLLLGLASFAQDEVVFTGEAPNVVELGERFRLVYSVNASGRNFKSPNLDDITILAGPSSSTSSSVNIINGEMTKSYRMTYTFIAQFSKEGTFTIKPASITVDDKTYQSNEITIEVVKGVGNRTTATAQSNGGNNKSNSGISDKEIFLKIIPSKTSVYVGENITTTVKLYSKSRSVQSSGFRMPSFNGFWSQDIEIPQAQLVPEKYNNQVFQAAVLKKNILYPQHSGKIVIPSAEMDLQIYVQSQSRSPFDDFFGATQSVNKTVKSLPVTIEVKELPTPKPIGFDGSVGNFKISSSVDKTDVKANDAVTLKVTVSGSGNLKLLKAPTVSFPADFEAYEPKTVERIKNSESGQIGSKTFEYLVIPRYGGEYTIPSVKFSYFDVSTKSYKEISTPEYPITVEQSTDMANGQIVSGISKEDVKYLNKDIRFINTAKTRLIPTDKFMVNSLFFYLLYPSVFIILLIMFFVRRKYINDNRNITIVKNRKANKMARKRLKNAESLLKSNKIEAFYDETLKALWGYLGDKLMIPVADLSKDRVGLKLAEKEVDQAIIDEFKDIVSTCEFARFAPAKEAQNMDATFKRSVEVITNIDQKIK